jgi:hypothetical protein
MAAFKREELSRFWGLNGGHETYMQKLIQHVGTTHPSALIEICDTVVANEAAPDALRNLVRTFRLMFRELDTSLLEGPCEEYKRADTAWKAVEKPSYAYQEQLDRDTAQWAEMAAPARKLMAELQLLEADWAPQSGWERFGAPMIRLPALSQPCPNIPAAIEEFLRSRSDLKQERDRLFAALESQLLTDDGFEGVAEMEALDKALAELDKFADECDQRWCAMWEWQPQAIEAHWARKEAYGNLAREMWKLPTAGQVALVRLANLLYEEAYVEFRQEFAWMLKPRALGKSTPNLLPVTVSTTPANEFIEWQ